MRMKFQGVRQPGAFNESSSPPLNAGAVHAAQVQGEYPLAHADDVISQIISQIVSDHIMQADGIHEMIAGFVACTLFWLGLFYLTAYAERWWGKYVPKSTKEHENDKYWLTRHYLGSLMSVIVCCITVPALFFLWDLPAETKFAHTSHLATCRTTEFGEPLATWGVRTAFAGMVFTSYIMADSVTMFVHGWGQADYIAHHVAFIAAGLLIRCNCMLPFSSAVLMTMEISTPSLNFLLLYRHRGDGYETSMAINGVLFFVLFVIVRIALNSWGAYELVIHRKEVLIPVVPFWQAQALLVMVLAGVGVQFIWLPGIVNAFGSNLVPLLRSTFGWEKPDIAKEDTPNTRLAKG